jgi:4-hydroxy-tetrahydrodipicolinate reductase
MVRLLADALHVTLDAIDETTERYVATERFAVPMTAIEVGTVSAIRFQVAGIVAGKPAIVAEHVTRTRADQAPDWPKPPSGHGSVHRVAIEGSPSLTLDLALSAGAHGRAGLLVTAMRIVNAIPAVCDAPPGLVTTLDLPIAPRRRLMRP